MGDYVEARSLASLNALASNPPQYPTNPAEKKQEPLTLYISRVPGTRDVILSTFKPQVKNVTAEDVASSLYYVHLDTPEDEQLMNISPVDIPSRPSLESSRSGNLINRKPVPGAPHVSALGKLAEPAAWTPGTLPGAPGAPNGKENHPFDAPPPVPPHSSGLSHATPAASLAPQRPPQPAIHRKPIGSRPVTVDTQAKPPEPPPREYLNLPPRPDEIDDHPDYGTHLTADPGVLRPGSRSPSPSKRKPFTPFSLTLIRRDRSSGQQWNVGKIGSFQLEHPEQIPEDKYAPSPSINIHLETPGYSKFRGMPPPGATFDIRDIRESLDMMRPGNSTAPGAAPSPPQRARDKPVDSTPQSHSSPISSHVFERQVKMTYAPSWTSNIRNAFRRPQSREGDMSTSPRRPAHDRSGSVASIGSFGGDFDGGEAPVLTVPGHGLKPQGYMFTSPWDGRCEFRTGNGGRSLRCRHVLPTHGTQWNPLADGGANMELAGPEGRGHRRNGSRSPKAKGNDISELRFNLPSAELFNTKPADPNRPAGLHEARERTRDKILNAMTNKSEDDVDDDEYEYLGFDLSLGREKAGGGNRGKRAKMGKLIIWEEGLKMLDLAVAANIAGRKNSRKAAIASEVFSYHTAASHLRMTSSSSSPNIAAMASTTDSTSCASKGNSTDCLLQSLIDVVGDQIAAENAKTDWDPITFAFTVPVGIFGICATLFALITVLQGIFAASPGRRKSSRLVIGRLYTILEKAEKVGDNAGSVYGDREKHKPFRYAVTQQLLALQKAVGTLLSKRFFTGQDRTNEDGSTSERPLRHYWKPFQQLKRRRRKGWAGWTFKDDTLNTPVTEASWLQFLSLFNLVDLELEGPDLAVTAADYLPDDLRAVPAYADVHTIIALAGVAGVRNLEPETGSSYTILIAKEFQVDFRQHPILGTAAAFSSSSLFSSRLSPLHRGLMAALKHANGHIEIQPRNTASETPGSHTTAAEFISAFGSLKSTNTNDIKASLHRHHDQMSTCDSRRGACSLPVSWDPFTHVSHNTLSAKQVLVGRQGIPNFFSSRLWEKCASLPERQQEPQ
ncbi:hypothetical protein JX266_005696 [Neoarthrinium moseri]|nr:hypothetical protein JX266_005696 [Neoarthrinium moseri]